MEVFGDYLAKKVRRQRVNFEKFIMGNTCDLCHSKGEDPHKYSCPVFNTKINPAGSN